jgi:hypothetical protein
MRKKAKHDFIKVKYFNCDDHKHLVKDCPKPPWVHLCISQGKEIFQGDFMVEIGANKSEVSNLLKLRCKMNNKFLC